MIKQLLDVFRREDPDRLMGSRLSTMLQLAEKLVAEAGKRLFDGPGSRQDRDAFFEDDQQINTLQQAIRKSLVGRLELSTATDRARFLVIAGLVKDLERLGDYAKNLLEAAEMLEHPLPDNDHVRELSQIKDAVQESLGSVREALLSSDTERARSLIGRGHQVSQRCERLIAAIAGSTLPARIAVPLALATRHYKRIQKHMMNALTTVTMPLHKVDYFDEPD